MRVIAGRAKGHQLKGPRGPATRPTSDKVRGAIFAMLESLLETERPGAEAPEQPSLWEGRRVLDLYAGTGALGIEALSRGAQRADFVERNRGACQVIRENLARTKLAAGGHVFCGSVQEFIRRLAERAARGAIESYDLVLVDAPYAEPGLEDVLAALGANPVLRPGGWLVVEHERRRALPANFGDLALVKSRCHGDTMISIYLRCHPKAVAAATSGEAPGRN